MMRLVPLSALVIGLAIMLAIPAIPGRPDPGVGYEAAIFASGPGFMGEQLLRLFSPGGGKETDILLPVSVDVLAVGPDGKTLYAAAAPAKPGLGPPSAGLFKIEFNPTRIGLVPGSSRFVLTTSLAVSSHHDKLLVSGPYLVGAKASCGIYEFTPGDGAVRKVLDSAGCQVKEAWNSLSLSPDGLRAVAVHTKQLELIDLDRGTTKILGSEFYKAAWSPDGRWIAAHEYHTEDGVVTDRIILFDAVTLIQKRALGRSENSPILWSPDSRYLLAWKWQLLCGPEIYTLEKIDVETGKRSSIEGSRCKVNENKGGWVSGVIARKK